MKAAITSGLLDELRRVQGLHLWTKAPLAPFTTVGTGGRAALIVSVSRQTALATALAALERAGVPWMCLGAGSNLLVADEGYPAAVIKLNEEFQYVEGLPAKSSRATGDEPAIVTVGGGAPLVRLVTTVVQCGLSGLEFACGIPGSLGGAVAMNAGAHGLALAEVVEAVELVSSGGAAWLPADGLDWAYRCCNLPRGSVVTAVRLRLSPEDPAALLERQRALLRARRLSQPRGVRTFGSVFKNPPGDSAGRLLDASGVKGVRWGGAEISPVHANFLVNLGDATTADMLVLMSLMREAVYRADGILLEPEVKLLGRRFPWETAEDVSSDSSSSHG